MHTSCRDAYIEAVIGRCCECNDLLDGDYVKFSAGEKVRGGFPHLGFFIEETLVLICCVGMACKSMRGKEKGVIFIPEPSF